MVTKAFFDETGMKSADKVSASSTQQHTTAAQHYPAQNPPQRSQSTGTHTQTGSPQNYYNYYGQPAHHLVPPSRNQQQPYYPGYTNAGYVNNTNSDGYTYNQNNIPNHSMTPIQAHRNKSTNQGSSTSAPGINSTSATLADNLAKSSTTRRNTTNDTGTPNIILTTIQENDVTHGKGSSFTHKGNEKYRHCLKKYYKIFIQAPVNEKINVALMIHNEIASQTPEGRFLIYNHKQKGWELMATKESAEYINHVLSDCELREKKRLQERKTVEVHQNEKKQKTSSASDAQTPVITLDDSPSFSPSPSPIVPKPTPTRTTTPKNTQETRPTAVDKNEKKSSAVNVSDETTGSSKDNMFQSRHCNNCLGTGLLPVPEALVPFTNSFPTGHLPLSTPFPQQLLQSPLIPTSYKHTDAEMLGTTDNDDAQRMDASTKLNGTPTLLGDNLRILEEKWEITNGCTLTYPERVRQIEEKVRNQQISVETETAFLQNDHVLQMLEEAERKWGIEAPDGYNLGQRVELIEKTAFSFMSRLKVWL